MFKMNIFLTFLCVSMLTVTLGIEMLREDETKECSGNKTVFLINAENGMRFYMENNTDGTVNITYDCSLGNSYEGTISLNDREHPRRIDSMFIKKCLRLTVTLNTCSRNFKLLQITGTEEVEIYARRTKPLETVITDVKMLKFGYDPYRYDCLMNKTSLILKNVVVKGFEDPTIDSIYMTGVTVQGFGPDSLFGSLLSIKDSRIDYLKGRSFSGNIKQVYIVNNTFEEISSRCFNLLANESFVFSDNHVKRILDGFTVTSPKVEIVGNTIDYAKDAFFKIHLFSPDFEHNIFKSLNVSLNKVNAFQNHLVELTKDSEPDFLVIKRNYFNCSCKTSLYLEEITHSNSRNITTKLLLDDNSNNVCVNFNNCPLRKLLGKEVSMCSNEFVCPQDFSDVSAISFKEISSELKNLTEALYLFMEQNQKFKDFLQTTPTVNYTPVGGF